MSLARLAPPTSPASHGLEPIVERLLALRLALPDADVGISTSSLTRSEDLLAAHRLGAGFAVDARSEIDRLEREGIAIAGCIHTRPATPVAEITGAYLRGVRVFAIGDAAELVNFRELPEVAVLVRLDFRHGRRQAAGVPPHAAAAVVLACRAAGIRVAGFSLGFGRGRLGRPRRVRRTLALMRRLERAEQGRFDTLDLDLDLAGTGPVGHGVRSVVHGAARRYRVIARRAG